ncbi:MAG: RNA polymerase sigma factor [Clostridia bacterium]|nr:RNA polymerase sigma factor [Clostridia bacterium]
MKKRNQESFAFLFEQYGKKVYSLAFRMCGNKEDAEDIVQKAFIQAITCIDGFKGESSIYTWLYTITRNLCLKLLEERKKSSFSALDQLINTAKSIESSDNFTVLEKQHYISQVKEGCLLGLLRCLSFYQRIAFILNILLEVKVKEVAAIINKSETATRVLIHRAKQNLKNFLCKNCSLYDAHNPCHCENLINFSIKQGWIQKANSENTVLKSNNCISAVEREINSLKKITLIYKSMEEDQLVENRVRSFRNEISRQSYTIFFNKKVK